MFTDNLDIRRGWMVNTMPLATLLPRKKPDTHGTEGLADHRTNLDGCRNLATLGFEPWTIQSIACCYPG
jgi:hypothetical protein